MMGKVAFCAAVVGATWLVGSTISYIIYFREKRKSTWLETSGMLALVELTNRHNEEEDRPLYEVVAEYWYEYSANGKTCYGLAYKSVQAIENPATKADLERMREQIYQRFPLGSKTTIFFDPRRPNKAEAIHARTTLESTRENLASNLASATSGAIIVLLFICMALLLG